MSIGLSLKENNQDVINQAIQQLQQGRINSTGTITLTTGTSTTVNAPTCSNTSIVILQEITADAAAARFTAPYVIPTPGNQEFTLAHASGPADRTFWWAVLGGN